jgi:hypothetical protein
LPKTPSGKIQRFVLRDERRSAVSGGAAGSAGSGGAAGAAGAAG